MIKPYKKYAALFLIPGYVFWLIFLINTGDKSIVVKISGLVGLALFLLGCWALAKSKGYHWGWGLLGLLHIGGPIILAFFRDKTKADLQRNDQTSEQDTENNIEMKLKNTDEENFKSRWNKLNTDELKTIYLENDREKWTDAVFQTIEQILKERGKKTVDKAVARLSAASGETRVAAAMELLKSPSYEVRAAIASEVARLKINAVGPWYELANALADDVESVRQASAKAFWQLNELGGISYAIRSLRDEHESPAHMDRESALRGIHTLMEAAPEKRSFVDLLQENWEDCPIHISHDLSKSEKSPKQKDGDERPECAKCGHCFMWDEAYKCQDTPGTMPYTPQGYGDYLARIFCPRCGAIVVQWHITSEKDYDEWAWFGENATINQGRSLPPNFLLHWGLSIPKHLIPAYHEKKLDIEKILLYRNKEKA